MRVRNSAGYGGRFLGIVNSPLPSAGISTKPGQLQFPPTSWPDSPTAEYGPKRPASGPRSGLQSAGVERREPIEQRLREGLDADRVEVVAESHLHAGHAGAREGGGHFRALVFSARFQGASRVERQRLVYGVLADAMGGEIHALSMRTLTPEEWAAQRGA